MTTVKAPIERNLAMELVRVTEIAAMNAARWMGRGDKNAADDAAVRGMRAAVQSIDMDGIVVIGEGEKDEAPMLYFGEKVGNGNQPAVDIAVDPLEGTRLTSLGLPNALSVIALAERGAMFGIREIVYMNKIAVGPEAAGSIDILASPSQNLRWIAKAKRCLVSDLTVCILDRDRHAELIAECRRAGARIKLIPDGDVSGGISPAVGETGVDVLMGVGGATEAVLTAAAMRCLKGEIQCQLWPRNDDERQQAEAAGYVISKVYSTEDLVGTGDVFFAATGVTDGEMLKGVRYFGGGATTNSIVMRSHSGTVRWVTARHDFEQMRKVGEGSGIIGPGEL
ncbi:MAG TPA: class II fructose-bisphosphatase [Dehalococcoidia bacterium]|nr:class II fructose-bisphosphatase [Dehalococcoidia bacterium]